MRLDKYLCSCMLGSRQEVKKLIKSGTISVNNEIIKKDDYKVDEEKDEVKYKDELIKYQKYTYLILNKPSGYVTSTMDKDKTVMDLLPQKYHNLSPVGRLDKDTEGLLLFTNDGITSHNLTSPKKGVNKTYYVELLKEINDEVINIFKEGLKLDDGYITKPSILEIITPTSVYLTISEGKYHQVKRMFLSINNKVIYLKRISFGSITLPNDLEIGSYRELKIDEKEKLLQS